MMGINDDLAWLQALASDVHQERIDYDEGVSLLIERVHRDTISAWYSGEDEAFERATGDDDEVTEGLVWDLVEAAADRLEL